MEKGYKSNVEESMSSKMTVKTDWNHDLDQVARNHQKVEVQNEKFEFLSRRYETFLWFIFLVCSFTWIAGLILFIRTLFFNRGA